MDLYQTLNSLAPSFYLGENSNSNAQNGFEEIITDFPPGDEPVYILGRKYSSLYELDDIRQDVTSIIWVTYRRNFTPIGDSGLTSDAGWGCMLRTGQMVLAEALVRQKLGRTWRWLPPHSEMNESDKADRETYLSILRQFSDSRTAQYSIHQIALMGACEGKAVGEWFGPNTVAQVLKKLSLYDKLNNIHIHVALDNMVFIDDIKKFCRSKIRLESIRMKTAVHDALDLNNQQGTDSGEGESAGFWRPLVLFIPLRLGLSDLNPVYFRAIKSTFAFPQSLGILGGRPNHALYFIGCVGDDLVYLDPHTTQNAVDLSPVRTHSSESADGTIPPIDDSSYHCERASRMPISALDPSISLCFLCRTEEEFDQWANLILRKLIQEEEQPLFEIMKERPRNWPQFEDEFDLQPSVANNVRSAQSTVDANDLSTGDVCLLEDDEDYEIIDF